MTDNSNLAETVQKLSDDEKRALLAMLVKDVGLQEGLQEVAIHDEAGTLCGYFVPAARRYLLKENTEYIEDLKRRAENPGKSIPWQEFKRTLEALGS